VETANLLRLLTPDVAEFWTYLYNGTRAAGVHALVQFLSVIQWS